MGFLGYVALGIIFLIVTMTAIQEPKLSLEYGTAFVKSSWILGKGVWGIGVKVWNSISRLWDNKNISIKQNISGG
jgi:hypothetical protein